jgi:hypothetical protein
MVAELPYHLSTNLNIKICKAVTVPVVLYGFETWCFTLRQLMKIFGPRGNSVGRCGLDASCSGVKEMHNYAPRHDDIYLLN